MVDGWEATLLDVAPASRAVGVDRADTGSPDEDVIHDDTGAADFDPDLIIDAAPKVFRNVARVAGGTRTTAGRVLTHVAKVGGDMATGAAMGAAAGSVIPGIGTAIGGVIGAGAGLVGGLISLFSHHDDDPVERKLHALAQQDPRRYGADLVIYRHNHARYHALAREHELPSERWGRRAVKGGIDGWLRRTHMSQGAQLASRFGGRPLAERVLLGYAAATDSLQDVEQALDGITHTPKMPPRATFRQLVRGLGSAQIARVAAAFSAGPDAAVETYRAVRRELEDAEGGARAQILRALAEQWAKGSPASVALFERLARSYSPDQAQRLRRGLLSGDAGAVFRQIERANHAARDHLMNAAFERYVIEWFAHKADAHPATPAAETPLRQAENIDVMPLRSAPRPARPEVVNLLMDDVIADDDAAVMDTGDALAFAPVSPGGWVPGHWERHAGRPVWVEGHWEAVPTFAALTEGFGPAHFARLHEAIDRGHGLTVFRRIVEERMARARAAREARFLAELQRIGCVPGRACPIPAERLAGFSPLWASYAPDQVIRIQNALLSGEVDPLLVFRELERESHDDRVRRLYAGWGHYLSQWNTAGGPNPAAMANYASVVTERLRGNDTAGLLDEIGAAIGSMAKSAGAPGGASPLDALGELVGGALHGGGIEDLARRAATAIEGVGHGGGPMAELGNLAQQAAAAVENAAHGHGAPGNVAKLGGLAKEAVAILHHAASNTAHAAAKAHVWPAQWADFGAKVQQGLAAIGLDDLAGERPARLLALLPPKLGIAKDADRGLWWRHLTVAQGIGLGSARKLGEAVRAGGGAQAIPQLVERYRALIHARFEQLSQERERVFTRIVDAMKGRFGGMFDPWGLAEINNPLMLLTHRMDAGQITRLRDAFAMGADALSVFREIERENQEGHAARAVSYFQRYLASRRAKGEAGDPAADYMQGALKQAAAVLEQAQQPGFGNLPGLAAALQNALGALQQATPPAGNKPPASAPPPSAPPRPAPADMLQGLLQGALGALQQAQAVPGLESAPALQGAVQTALGALQGAQAPGFDNPAALQAVLQSVLGALHQTPGAEGVPGLDNLPVVLQSVLGALQGANGANGQRPGFFPRPFPQPQQQAPSPLGGILDPGVFAVPGLFGTETAGPVTEDGRPCPLFHLSLPQMSVPAWKTLYRLVPNKQPIGVQQEIAGVRGRARDVSGVDAVTGEYVATPGETPWSIAEKLVGDGRREHELLACNPVHAPSNPRWRLPPSWFQFIQYVGPVRWHAARYPGETGDAGDEAGAVPLRGKGKKKIKKRPGHAQQARRGAGTSAMMRRAAGPTTGRAQGPTTTRATAPGRTRPQPQASPAMDGGSDGAAESNEPTVVFLNGDNGGGGDEGYEETYDEAEGDTGDPDAGDPDEDTADPDEAGDAEDTGDPDEAGDPDEDTGEPDEAGEANGADIDVPGVARNSDPNQLVSRPGKPAVPARTSERPTLTSRTYHVNVGDSPSSIAGKLGARSRAHWWRELVEANPQLAVKNGNFVSFVAGSTINIPDTWPPSKQLQAAPGLAPRPSPAPVAPGPMPAFPAVDDAIPALSGVLGVPLGSAVKGATVDRGTLLRVEGQLLGWAVLHPGKSGCSPEYGPSDVTGVVTERTTAAMAAWERWHNSRGESPALPTDGVITPAAATALNHWWEAEGHRLADEALAHKGAPKHGQKPGPRPASGPAPVPHKPAPPAPPPPNPGVPGLPQLDLGWIAAQAQAAAAQATEIAKQAVSAAQAGGHSPDLQAAAKAAESAAAKAAEEARRAVAEAQQAAQHNGTVQHVPLPPLPMPDVVPADFEVPVPVPPQPAPKAPPAPKASTSSAASKGGGDIVPLVSLAAALFGAVS